MDDNTYHHTPIAPERVIAMNNRQGSTLADRPPVPIEPSSFCDWECTSYCLGCAFTIIIGLALGGAFLLAAPPLGLLIAAVTPGVVILALTRHYYKNQVTQGQMIVSFLETIMWMIPLLIWDLIWVLAIAPQLKDGGLCGLCILAYLIQHYFFAGFCEEVVKFKVISRITNSSLTEDWRSMMVYGICAGCGFATAENILYVFSYGYITAIVRAFLSVPLHCTTGAIIGLGIAKRRPIAPNCQALSEVVFPILFVPWLVHGSFNFLLTIGENANSSLGILGFVGAVLFFVGGVAYARHLSFQVRAEQASAGNGKIDIHQRILAGQPPVLGLPDIRQWGTRTNCVCSCCFMCQCCCKNHVPQDLEMNMHSTQYAHEDSSGVYVFDQ
mmetsp:Transcript_12821/g.19295  ORF Transcript_12821/g.19295 Transcript_12821/m.19295 type:complete len:384 (-) Transcript_12821:242-1393(-)|eukprot:CAMPEP_0185040014 /NCGR_PEP_ID=MMETSP1103-20130426/37553_1 /TAXON_ID=36769 /ORGANISM="Paraphysomonas bandaiensis, Strain Caron Lab Isolate" /LENGTH=383 /DNA_ID=CAMNT_0027579129 /DNA_START=148 /DNA_END=1299 /DNA_ORIENTATION=-